MYQQCLDQISNKVLCVKRNDGWFFVFDNDNTDYQRFKQDIANGVELQDENGNILTPDEAKAFVATLP